MATEMITLKLETSFLASIDSLVQAQGYQSRTEFMRTALREKIEQTKLNQSLIALGELKGASNKRTSDDELERVRTLAYKELHKRVR